MNYSKDRLSFDAADTDESDNIGAYLRSADGTLLTHTTDGASERLDVQARSEKAEDSAHSSGDYGIPFLGVRQDAVGSLVDTDGDYTMPQFDANGRLRVDAEVSVSTGSDKIEDAAHADGDVGAFVLAVRQDTLSSLVSADGDYAPFKVDSVGRLYTIATLVGDVADDAADSGNPIKIGFRAIDGALAAVSADDDRADGVSDMFRRQFINNSPNIGMTSAAVSVDDTAGGTQLDGTVLTGRMKAMIQNLGSKDIFVGPSGLTALTGIRVAGRGGSLMMELGEDIDLYAIAQSGETNDVRIMQVG